jgi:hypothetical protein
LNEKAKFPSLLGDLRGQLKAPPPVRRGFSHFLPEPLQGQPFYATPPFF